MKPQPLSTCTREALGEGNLHALVYGRCRIWHTSLLTDEHALQWHWSKWAWWKAMNYTHRGSPEHASNWGLYAGSAGGSFTGPGDAEITHWMPMPAIPEGAETN